MKKESNDKRHASPQSLNAAVKSICDIMRRSNCAGALQYVPELTWILFLRILDEHEARGTPEQLDKLEAALKSVEKQARENEAKAQGIEEAAFDLKAVNPNRVSEQDTRTVGDLLDFITDKGKEADTALGRLWSLVASRESLP